MGCVAQEDRTEMDLATMIWDVPDFPVKGVLFKDITTLIRDADAFREAVDRMAERFQGRPIDAVVAIESRGFVFGAPIAYKLGAGFIPVRKPCKLPAETIPAGVFSRIWNQRPGDAQGRHPPGPEYPDRG